MTSHQLFLSGCETHLPDLRFLQVLFDEETQKYSVVTIHKERSSEEEEESVGFASEIQKTDLILWTFRYEFTLGMKTLQDNVM